MKTTIRRSALMGIALSALMSIATVTKANDENKQDKSASKVEFKYIGKRDHQSLFQLQMNIPQGEEYTIYFRDNQGYVLYSTVVKNNVSQKYAIDTDEVENTITVEVRSRKTNKSETFTIKRNQTLLDETVVARID
jgi:hypothetical protein